MSEFYESMSDEEQIKFFNEKSFSIVLLETTNFDFSKLNWNNPNYAETITSQPFVKTIEVSDKNFFETLKNKMNLDKSSLLVTQIIAEEPLANFELIYQDTTNVNANNNLEINYFASILNTNGEIVKGNAIVVKNHIATLTNEKHFEIMDVSELNKLMYHRAFNKVVIWDDVNEKWMEDIVFGDIEFYAKKFFDNEKYDTCEIAFLKHNLNILYLKSEYGKVNACGSLLNCPVEKILIFTMLTPKIRGNLTIDEVKKIIELSTKLTPPFKPDDKWFEDEKDQHGRPIIKNKYRILDNVYQENLK